MLVLKILVAAGPLELGKASRSVLEASTEAAVVPYAVQVDQRCALAEAALGGWIAGGAAIAGKVIIAPGVGDDT